MVSKSLITTVILCKVRLPMISTKLKIKFMPTLLFKKKVKCKIAELRNEQN